jgi:hypothetical protein
MAVQGEDALVTVHGWRLKGGPTPRMAPLASHFTHYREPSHDSTRRDRPFRRPDRPGLCRECPCRRTFGPARRLHEKHVREELPRRHDRPGQRQDLLHRGIQAPDRYRIKVEGGPESVIAGGNMYMQVNGQSMKVPLQPGMLEKFRSDAAWKQMEKDTLIQGGGAGTVGAEPARKSTGSPAESTRPPAMSGSG